MAISRGKLSNKKAPIVKADPSVQRGLHKIYADMNELINSVNSSGHSEIRDKTSGKPGDIRAFKDKTDNQYYIEAKFKEGWAKRQLFFMREDERDDTDTQLFRDIISETVTDTTMNLLEVAGVTVTGSMTFSGEEGDWDVPHVADHISSDFEDEPKPHGMDTMAGQPHSNVAITGGLIDGTENDALGRFTKLSTGTANVAEQIVWVSDNDDKDLIGDSRLTFGDSTLNPGPTPPKELRVDGDFVVTGDATIEGATTNLDTSDLFIADHMIDMNYSEGNDETDEQADGGGWTLHGGTGAGTGDKTIIYRDTAYSSEYATSTWELNQDLSINVSGNQNVYLSKGPDDGVRIFHDQSWATTGRDLTGITTNDYGRLYIDKDDGGVLLTNIDNNDIIPTDFNRPLTIQSTNYEKIRLMESEEVYSDFRLSNEGNLGIGMTGGGAFLDNYKMLGSANFQSGFVGTGWRIDHDISSGASATFDNMTIRGALRVYELIINQIRATNGSLLVTSAAKVEEVGLIKIEDAVSGYPTCSHADHDIGTHSETFTKVGDSKVTFDVDITVDGSGNVSGLDVTGTTGGWDENDDFNIVSTGTVTDNDGNIYDTVIINDKEWMVQSLRTTTYNNDSAIPTGLDNSTWTSTTDGAYAVYDDNPDNAETYGNLYNWYAVETGNLAPTGWHVATDAELTDLEDYLTAQEFDGTEGNALKEEAYEHWTDDGEPDHEGLDAFGFTALPGGDRNLDGNYVGMGLIGFFWSSTENFSFYSWSRLLYYSTSGVSRFSSTKNYGYSVRCVRDAEFLGGTAHEAQEVDASGMTVYDIRFEDPSENGLCPFTEGDIIMAQVVDLGGSVSEGGTGDIVKRIVRVIDGVAGQNVNVSTPGYAYVDTGAGVAIGDDFVRLGSTLDTDRTGGVYITSDDDNAPFIDVYDNVGYWGYNKGNYDLVTNGISQAPTNFNVFFTEYAHGLSDNDYVILEYPDSGEDSGFKSLIVQVTTASPTGTSFIIDDTDPAGEIYDEFTTGNAVDSWYIRHTEGVNDSTGRGYGWFDHRKSKARFGDLTGITDIVAGLPDPAYTGNQNYGLYSQNVYLKGKIQAVTGYIGDQDDGWAINSGKIFNNNFHLDAAGQQLRIGSIDNFGTDVTAIVAETSTDSGIIMGDTGTDHSLFVGGRDSYLYYDSSYGDGTGRVTVKGVFQTEGGAALGAGLNWGGEWTDATAYAINDAVSYNGGSWICEKDHTSTALIESVLVALTAGGSGYSEGTPPTVTIGTSDTGVDATCTVVVTGDVVTSIVMDNSGSGYTSSPSFTTNHNGGAGFTHLDTLEDYGAPRNNEYWGSLAEPAITWHSGNGAPSTSVGRINDMYLRLDTEEVYKKIGDANWGDPIINLNNQEMNWIFTYGFNKPDTPSPSSGVPTDWYDTVALLYTANPEPLGAIWGSQGTEATGGSGTYTWDEPVQIEAGLRFGETPDFGVGQVGGDGDFHYMLNGPTGTNSGELYVTVSTFIHPTLGDKSSNVVATEASINSNYGDDDVTLSRIGTYYIMYTEVAKETRFTSSEFGSSDWGPFDHLVNVRPTNVVGTWEVFGNEANNVTDGETFTPINSDCIIACVRALTLDGGLSQIAVLTNWIGTDGISPASGAYHSYVYHNKEGSPETPTGGDYDSDGTENFPTGNAGAEVWTDDPSDPTHPKVTWISHNRYIHTPVVDSWAQEGDWSAPAQFSGNGVDGLSAYEQAVAEGFSGTLEAWVESLVGDNGLSAYEQAVAEGYPGTLGEWLDSLQGNGGLSAYELAVAEGFPGTLTEWLDSLQGAGFDVDWMSDSLSEDFAADGAVAGSLATHDVIGHTTGWPQDSTPAEALATITAGMFADGNFLLRKSASEVGLSFNATSGNLTLSSNDGKTSIEGPCITTGKIQSQDEKTYFDLSANKIVVSDGSIDRVTLGQIA